MKKNYILLSIFCLLMINCSANLLNQRIEYHGSSYQKPNNDKVAVISDFKLYINGGFTNFRNRNALKQAVADAIESTGIYSQVLTGKKDFDSGRTEADEFQVHITARDLGKYNWMLAWPAVYPMTLYWPLQPYKGIVVVEYKIKFTRGNFYSSHIISNEKQHEVTIYGFFNKKDVENKVIPLYYDGLDQLREYILTLNSSEIDSSSTSQELIAEKFTGKLAPWSGKTKNIAILNLGANGISRPEVNALTNRLGIEMFNTGRFSILERSQMEEILKEQGFQQSGCTSSECALEAGQLLNVEQMVTGSISKVGEIYSVEVRLIDVESGKIVAVGVEDIRGGIEDVLTSGMNKVVWDMLR